MPGCSISLTGDLMIETPFAGQPASREATFRETLDELGRSDLVISNLEMPLSTRGYRVPKYANLCSDPAIIEDVRAMGIQAVSLANNHMMDYGPPALLDTLAACAGAGIAHCGAGRDLEAADAPALLSAGGRRVALVSVACTLPVESEAGPGKPGIAPLHVGFSFEIDTNLLAEQPGTVPLVRSWAQPADRDRVCRQVRALKEQVDLVIVAIHWGVPAWWLSPYQGILAEYQQPLGHDLIEAGADLVWGHHAHALHPIEVYRGKPICYSLGNFLFEGAGARAYMGPESVIVRLTLGERLAVELVPLLVNQAGFPGRAHGEAAERVFAMLAQLSEPLGTQLEVDRDQALARLVLE